MDAPRLLARRSELGYTTAPTLALMLEPEAVSATDQADITRQAHEHAATLRRTQIEAALSQARRDAEYHAAQLRHAERRRVRLERALTA